LLVNELVAQLKTDAKVGPIAQPPPSFEEVYRSEWAPLVRLAMALCGSREVAEDVVHDAFVRASTGFEGVNNPSAYLRAAVVNGVRDRHRRSHLEGRHPPAPPVSSAVPELDETWAVLQLLPERYRTALVLRFYLDLPVGEVARLIGCREGTAKSLIHRGLQRLKERLEHEL
jgi:RNA polymerase sigma factor (sigma-70 family)